MKPPDLSTRQNGIVKAPSSPVFSRRNANPTGTLTFAAAGSQALYQAPGSVTVLWVMLQVRTATTLQIFKNGEALSLPYICNSGAVLHYCGMLLLGNESLNITSSAPCSIDYEMAVVKEHDERLIVTDIRFWNPSAGVKKTTIEFSGTLAANQQFVGAWHDSEADGTVCVTAFAFGSVPAGSGGGAWGIQGSDDISNPSMTFSLALSGSAPAFNANALNRAFAILKCRYYRVVLTNSATPGTWEITSHATSFFYPATANVGNNPPYGGNNGSLSEVMQLVCNIPSGTVLAQQDAFGIINWMTTIEGPATNSGVPLAIGLLYNGASWDRPRNNVNAATGDTGAKVATFNGATQTNFDAEGAYITVLLGAVTGTTPTLTMQLQWSPDGGTTWLNLGPASATLTASSQTAVLAIFPTNFSQTAGATPANLTTGANVSTFLNAPLPRTWRIVYTIAGTTPSFTISSVQVNYIRG